MKRLLLISAIWLIALPAAGRERHRDNYREGFRDGEQYAEDGYRFYECKGRVTATGNARWSFGGKADWARSNAEEQWRRAVLLKYGERYMAHPVKKTIDCVKAGVSGPSWRCEYGAVACAGQAKIER